MPSEATVHLFVKSEDPYVLDTCTLLYNFFQIGRSKKSPYFSWTYFLDFSFDLGLNRISCKYFPPEEQINFSTLINAYRSHCETYQVVFITLQSIISYDMKLLCSASKKSSKSSETLKLQRYKTF
jgi:hypothetical protein